VEKQSPVALYPGSANRSPAVRPAQRLSADSLFEKHLFQPFPVLAMVDIYQIQKTLHYQ
jgi:hypothetical protein